MTSATLAREAAPATDRRGLRLDIQGLRAVAVGIVLLFHAGVPGLEGGFVGVDVFFVISGFLITGLIVREVRRTGRLSLLSFYARRARRLLPATAVVFVAVTVGTLLVLPWTRWESIAGDLVASTLYVVNWRLAADSVDYLASDQAASPLQHFWSLAVEEQFYVVWPLVVVALAWWARRRRGSVSDGRMLGGLLVIAVPSLVWSVHLTSTQPGPAYFVTTTRLWELTVGAILAIGATRAGALPRAARRTVGWVGLAAIVAAVVLYDESTPFPGVAALLPVLGAAAVIAAGCGDGEGRLRVLDPAPMQHLGAWSYSLYLWHWPAIVLATAVWGRADGSLPLPVGLAAVAASVPVAWLAFRLVERPFHQSRFLSARLSRSGWLALVCIGVGLVAAGTLAYAAQREADQRAEVVVAAEHPGAAVLPVTPPVEWVPQAPETSAFSPSPQEALEDFPLVAGKDCNAEVNASAPVECTYGDPDAGTVVAVVGDSKMYQWMPALTELADRNDWFLKTNLKADCPFVAVPVQHDDKPYPSCRTLNEARVPSVVDDPDVDVVLTSQVKQTACTDARCRTATAPAMRSALVDVFGRLEAAGKRVIVVADNQSPGMEVPECLAAHDEDPAACTFPRKAHDVPTLLLAARDAQVPVTDVRPWICPAARCPSVIGGVLAYRQGSHISTAFAQSLTDVLGRGLAEQGLD
ncbi:acyltransferase [Cellulomonas sp. DKR-3]|uniref:Acyltransferase n=1 Tax=Cellulomonas fulva TaxID=2835530 RepID=A0ABS5TZK6_9CELL|nr:acyltransferase family protein [Cellulomonas fulva]MBT0994593.1 acyltransferase [Cellulomonas fulva]